MQEEVNQKTMCLIIQGGKISASVLKAGLSYFLRQLEKQAHQPGKQKTVTPPHGKQSLKQLSASGKKLTNIQITSKNIGTFDRVARKYCIDYSLKKDKTVSPPAYYVFFRAKDIDAMTAAFKEYSNDVAKKQARPSIRKKLAKAMEAVRNTLSTQRERHKHHEHSR